MSEPKTAEVKATCWNVGDFAERLEDHFLVRKGEVHVVTQMYRGGYLGFAGRVGGEWNPNGWRKVEKSARAAPASPPAETGEGLVPETGWSVAQTISQLEQEAEREGLPASTVNRLKIAAVTMRFLSAQPVSPSEGEGEAFTWWMEGGPKAGPCPEPGSLTRSEWEAEGYSFFPLFRTFAGKPKAWLIQDDAGLEARTPDRATTDAAYADRMRGLKFKVEPLYTHPASDQSYTERMRAALKRAKAVLENTAVSNALRVVGAHEIIGTALAEKAADQ